jgi:recombination protein RecA
MDGMEMARLRQEHLAWVGRSPAPATVDWDLERLRGRIVEISGRGASACLSAAFGLVLEAQRRGEWAAWIALRGSMFFPPDVDEAGVDLETLLVVRCADAQAAARAADRLVRSGGLGLVMLDLHARRGGWTDVPQALLTRLLGLAQKHHAALVLLSEKPAILPSVSSLVSLRAEAQRGFNDGVWEVRLEIVKDKRFRPGGVHVEARRGPDGLR